MLAVSCGGAEMPRNGSPSPNDEPGRGTPGLTPSPALDNALRLVTEATGTTPVSTPNAEPPTSVPAPEWIIGTPGSVYLNPKSQHAKVNSEFTVNLEVVPTRWGISAAEIQLSFDPQSLEALEVRPGGLLGSNPLIGMEKLDNQVGTVTYALARAGTTKPPGDRGTLATFRFKVSGDAIGSLKINIRRISLADEKFEEITGLATQGAMVTTAPARGQ